MENRGKSIGVSAQGIQYKTDSKGRTVRVPTRDMPVTKEEVVFFFKCRRGFDEDEALEAVGPNVLRFWKDKGYVREIGPIKGMFGITVKAQAQYGLPDPYLPMAGCTAKYFPAEPAKK